MTHAFDSTRSFAAHAHVVSSPDASSPPSSFFDPPAHAAHVFSETYSSTPHFVAEHAVSSPDASSPPSAFVVPGGHEMQALSFTRSSARQTIFAHVASVRVPAEHDVVSCPESEYPALHAGTQLDPDASSVRPAHVPRRHYLGL